MKKHKKKSGRRFLRSRWPVLLAILLQFVFLCYILISGSRISQAFLYILTGTSILCALVILSGKGENAYKLTWIFWILALPIFGGFFYMVLQAQWSKKSFARRARESEERIKAYLTYPKRSISYAESQSLPPAVRYLAKSVGYPTYATESTTYYPSGEEMHSALLCALEGAERYIFLEFFIIEEGKMWSSILEVLKRKAKEGVRVRVLYDDVGCFTHLPKRYFKALSAFGIEAAAFHPFVSLFSIEQNNRDHRKIAVIDGEIAFTGGVNLSDEYINEVEKFGHWKDAAVSVKGSAAWAFALMFLQMWELSEKTKEDILTFLPKEAKREERSLVAPYADSPMDEESVGENVYLSLIYNAKDYVYITTPYLIISDTMQRALTLAAKSGVDVRVITPKKWDKRIVHTVTRSYYADLLSAGVRVYEYTPGFIHAKTVVSDDRIASVGSVNFDYRSLYLHFECGTLIADESTVLSVKNDFLKTLSLSEPVTPENKKTGRIKGALLRLLAPLL